MSSQTGWDIALSFTFMFLLAGAMSFEDTDENGKKRVTVAPLIFLMGFLVPGAVSMLAGGRAGQHTVQVSGGRDPEYETFPTREVADSERWQIAQGIDTNWLLYCFIAIFVFYSLIPWLARKKENWKLGTSESRIMFGILAAFFYFVFLLRHFER